MWGVAPGREKLKIPPEKRKPSKSWRQTGLLFQENLVFGEQEI